MASRPVMAALLLVLTASLAGCNFQDFYNQVGTVRLDVGVTTEPVAIPGGSYPSRLNDFQSLQVVFRSAQLRQLDAANPVSTPQVRSEITDLVELAASGGSVTMIEEKVSMRGFTELVVRVEVIGGVTASGERVNGCEQGVAVPANAPPCIRYLRGGSYVVSLNPEDFRVERGGGMRIFFPFSVGYTEGEAEYFLGYDAPRTSKL